MQVDLTRTIRFCLAPDGSYDATAERSNTFAAWPPMDGLGRYYELHVMCRGDADPETGYFINIKAIDTAVREHGLPRLSDFVRQRPHAVGAMFLEMFEALGEPLDGTLRRLELVLTPTYALAMEVEKMSHVLIRQSFEFSAAHRLNVPNLSAEENVAIFGKCNNPSGHGHNYRFEVVVASPIHPDGSVTRLADLEKIVDDVVVERFDHKHLNEDTSDFATTNPSVEHISKVIYDLLEPAVGAVGVELVEITCWETGKTSCTYRPMKSQESRKAEKQEI